MNKIYVTDYPFLAAGDGITDDRPAIQSAIDYAHSHGGGMVVLNAGTRFLSSGIVIRSGVTLQFEDGAELYQNPNPDGYVKPVGDEYKPYRPVFGHNFSEKIKWSHNWYHNYPFIFVPEGSHNFAIKGNGIVRMMEYTDPDSVFKLCPIGFYRCHDFEISGIHITNYHGYAMMPFTSENGLIKDIVIDNWGCGNGDGICMMNCRNMRISGCRMFTGDDSLYIFSSYRDPRKGEWWSSDEPVPSENIEVDHNDLRSNHCKAFGMILWGTECPDFEKIEVRNVYIHDNHFETLGNWNYNPYSDKNACPPVTSIRFENNVIDGIECNFAETQISDLVGFPSMRTMRNCGFENGKCFWVLDKNEDEKSAGIVKAENGNFGYIRSYDKGRTAISQGIYIESGSKNLFHADVCGKGRLFVRESENGKYIATRDFNCSNYESVNLTFDITKSANYRIGMENGDYSEGEAKINDTRFGTCSDCKDVIFDNGKIIYKYNDNLFKR